MLDGARRARAHEPRDRRAALHLDPHNRDAPRSIMRKLRFDTRAQLVNYALANGLIGSG
jgi:hypothetical protein